VLALPVASLLPPCLVKNVSSPAGKSYARKIYHARLVTHDDLDVTMVAAHPDPRIQVHERHPHCFSSPIFMIHSGSMSSAPSPRNPQTANRLGALRFIGLSTILQSRRKEGRHVRPCIRSASPLSSLKLEPLISRRRGRFGSMLRRQYLQAQTEKPTWSNIMDVSSGTS
jgi:hypothetical protein